MWGGYGEVEGQAGRLFEFPGMKISTDPADSIVPYTQGTKEEKSWTDQLYCETHQVVLYHSGEWGEKLNRLTEMWNAWLGGEEDEANKVSSALFVCFIFSLDPIQGIGDISVNSKKSIVIPLGRKKNEPEYTVGLWNCKIL